MAKVSSVKIMKVRYKYISFFDVFILVIRIALIVAPLVVLAFILISREKERRRQKKYDAALSPKIIPYDEDKP